MRNTLTPLLLIVLLAAGCQTNSHTEGPAITASAQSHSADSGMFTPADIQWKDGPASLPPGAKVAILEGDPARPGIFTMRLLFPEGYRIPAHWHPRVERVTVISGSFQLGMGESFDPSALKTFSAGSFFFMPPRMRHFAASPSQSVLQLTGEGPWEINYINPADDPRKRQ